MNRSAMMLCVALAALVLLVACAKQAGTAAPATPEANAGAMGNVPPGSQQAPPTPGQAGAQQPATAADALTLPQAPDTQALDSTPVDQSMDGVQQSLNQW